MNLRTPYAYWLLRNGYMHSYPVFTKTRKADVVVVGAGITGAMTAYMLAKAGLHVLVLDKNHPGMGSTAASTALLQYEIDEPLHSLIEMVGAIRAEKSYRACYEAIDTLADLVEKENIQADFERVPSLQYAAYKKDVLEFAKELQARKKLNFDVELLGPTDLHKAFGFSAPAALLSANGGQVDAYRLAQGLLTLPMDNLEVYDLCEVKDMTETSRSVTVHLDNGATINAGQVILACGYDTLKFIPCSIAEMGASYAFASKPLPEASHWPNKTLLWDTKDPYLYARIGPEGRIIVGGRDDDTNNPQKRDKILPRKIHGLLADLRRLFPHLDVVPDYTWAGAFASTKDSLGYVDLVPGRSRIYCNLGFGGNGILYCLVGAKILRDRILRRKNEYDDIFVFDR